MAEQTTLSRLEQYQPTFMELRNRWLRTLVPTRYGLKSGDPELEFSWRATERHMNHLLDQYSLEQLGAVAIEGVPHEQIIAEHADMVVENGKAAE